MGKHKEHRKFRLGRLLLWLVIVLFVIITGTITYTLINARSLLHTYLPAIVLYQTDSIYHLDYDTLIINTDTRSLVIHDFSVECDTTRTNKPSFKKLKSDSIQINGFNLKKFIHGRNIRAANLIIENPTTELAANTTNGQNKLFKKSLNKGDTLELPFISEIFFDTILIRNAKIDLDTFLVAEQLPKLNIEAHHFKLGGIKMTDYPFLFDVSDAFLKLENLNADLPDSIHHISVDEVRFSMLSTKLYANNIKLAPISDTVLSHDIQFIVNIPEVSTSVPSINILINPDTLYFDQLVFKEPQISIKFGTNVSHESTPLNTIDLYKLIQSNLEWVKIKTFSIQNANLNLIPNNSTEPTQQFEGLNVNLYDFKVDSSSYIQKDRILSAKNIDMKIKRFTLFHSDNIHRFMIHDVTANTKTKSIETGIISFQPINKNNTNQTIIDITGKGLVLKDVLLDRLYHDKVLPMKQLIINEPIAEITLKEKSRTKKKQKDASILLDKLAAYLKGIYVDEAIIRNGSVSYKYNNTANRKGFFQANFNFNLKNLSVDSATFIKSDKVFFAEDFDVNFANIKLQLADQMHRLLTDSVYISSTIHTAFIEGFRILPLGNIKNSDSVSSPLDENLYDIYFPKIILHGTNLHNAFFYKKLNIREFEISRPEFSIETANQISERKRAAKPLKNSLYNMISDYLFSVNIKTLTMNNGNLNFNIHRPGEASIDINNKFSITMTNFLLDSLSSKRDSKLFFSDDIDLFIKDHSFNLADGIHKVKAGEIGILSSQNRFYIRDASLYPDILCDKFKKAPVTIFAKIPEMNATGADIVALFTKGKFPIQKVRFTKPEFQILFQPELKNRTTNQNKKPLLLPEELNSVNIGNIEIDQGIIELTNYINHQSKTLATSEIDFSISDINISSVNQQMNTSYSNFSLLMQNAIIEMPDHLHELKAQKITYNLNKPDLIISQFSISPSAKIDRNKKALFLDIQIPSILLSKLNFNQLWKNRNLSGNYLSLEQPSIIITDKRIEKGEKIDPYRLNLHPGLKDQLNSIQLNTINIQNASVKTNKLKLENIDITSHDFMLDEKTNEIDRLVYCETISAGISDISGKTKDGFYNYKIKDIAATNNGHITVSDIKFTPAYNKQKHFKLKQYQDDYFNIEIKQVSAWNFDFKRYFRNNEFNFSKVDLNMQTVDIFRDKRIPIDPHKKTKLPQQLLRELKHKVKIDTLNLSCNRLNYTEQEPLAYKLSQLYFNNVGSTILNINNRRETLDKNPILQIRTHGNIMGQALVNIDLELKLKSLYNEFSCIAKVDSMQLSHVNPIVEPGLKLSIREGFNKKLEARFEANEDSAVGNMKFYYNDLKVSILQNKDGELKEGKFTSFMANTFVKKDNPKTGKILIPAKMINKRDKQRSIINYLWKTIFAGIKSTMGMKEKEEKKGDGEIENRNDQ